MAVTSIVTCLLITYAFPMCVHSQRSRAPEHPRADSFRDTVTANDKIGLKLLQAFSKQKRTENIVFSPASVNLATAMLAEGARGRTAEQLHSFLELQKDSRDYGYKKMSGVLRSPSKHNKIKSANALFVTADIPIDGVYKDRTADIFQSEINNIDFGDTQRAAKKINDWVARVTENTIEQLVTPHALSPDTRMVISNAVYFKGKWKHPFPPTFTKRDVFTTEKGEEAAYMMRIQGYFSYKKFDPLDCAILELPYADGEYVMNIILPNGVVNMAQFTEKLSNFNLAELLSRGKLTEVEVTLPRFNIEMAQSLTGIFKQMNIKDVFGGQSDLSGISGPTHRLSVSEFFHKAVIQVSEEGTVAAAATGVYIIPLTGFLSPDRFRAERPFIYCIRHYSSNLLIFMGQVANPGLVGSPVPQTRIRKPIGTPVWPVGIRTEVVQDPTPWRRSGNSTDGMFFPGETPLASSPVRS